MPYKSLVQYVILAAALTLPRPELKSKIIDSPEVLEVIHELTSLSDFVTSLYECNYGQFYKGLGTASFEFVVSRS